MKTEDLITHFKELNRMKEPSIDVYLKKHSILRVLYSRNVVSYAALSNWEQFEDNSFTPEFLKQ